MVLMMRFAARLLVPGLVFAALAAPAAAQQGRPGWIGISLDIPVIEGRIGADSAVLIGDVRRGSPAEQAGLRAGDRLLALGEFRGAEDFSELPRRLRLSVGERVPVRVERDGRRIDVVVTAAERPQDLRVVGATSTVEPEALVETMMRAMDSLRVHLVQVRSDRGNLNSPGTPLRLGTDEIPVGMTAPFEFFVFRGEANDSLQRAMEDLNRLGRDLERRQRARLAELRGATPARADVLVSDEELRDLRTALDEVTRESAQLRAAMSEAARVSAAFDYLARNRDAQGRPGDGADDAPFRPLTPYLLGSNMVAGAQVVDLRPELARYFAVESGVLIVDVAPGTPAALAGLLPGDVITRLDQIGVRSVEEFRLGVSRSGDALPVTLVREGESLEMLLRRR